MLVNHLLGDWMQQLHVRKAELQKTAEWQQQVDPSHLRSHVRRDVPLKRFTSLEASFFLVLTFAVSLKRASA
jgi:hypothetical protein